MAGDADVGDTGPGWGVTPFNRAYVAGDREKVLYQPSFARGPERFHILFDPTPTEAGERPL